MIHFLAAKKLTPGREERTSSLGGVKLLDIDRSEAAVEAISYAGSKSVLERATNVLGAVLASQLYPVSRLDSGVFVSVPLLLLAVAVAATFLSASFP